MRLMIVRHGEPNYAIDSLTERGWKEAELLVPRMEKLDVKAFYVSPLGRARDTAAATLKAMDREAEILPWLREFAPRVEIPGRKSCSVCWDWLPKDWTPEERFFDRKQWCEPEPFASAGVKEENEWVCREFDKLLEKHGYVREKDYYRAVQPNEDTIVFFCHFGLECVLLGHLLNISPMALWHGTCAAPTSVTTVYTEERREGYAYFRMSAFGDTSHLYAAGMEPSVAARFCETYCNGKQPRD